MSAKILKDKDSPVPLPDILPGVFDAHTHLNTIASKDLAYRECDPYDPAITAIIDRAHTAGVTQMVTVADDLSSAAFAVKAASAHDGVYAAVAVHPVHAHQLDDKAKSLLEGFTRHKGVVAIGETGMDHYWVQHNESTPSLYVQEESFRWHIDLAKRTGKALMIHNRDCDAGILRILDSEGAPQTVIFHCFSSDAVMAKKCLDQGYILSFSGTVTFKNSHALREAVVLTPLDQMLVETDAPFLTPHPYRGRLNEPYCLPYTVRYLADLFDLPATEIAAATRATAQRVYGLA